MPTYKVVQTSAPPGADLPAEREGLAEFADGLVSYGPLDTPEKLVAHCRDADAILTPGARFTEEVLAKLERCRAIVRYGVGYDTIDVPAASAHHVLVVNIPDFCQPEVANHALAHLLDCAKKITRQDRWMRAGDWHGGRAPFLAPMGQIHGQTAGLIGLGAIARDLVRRLQVLDMRVIAYDPYVSAEAGAALGVAMLPLDEVLRRSDYVSIHTPLTPETRHLMNAERFAMMKPTACLINTSRGPVVDEAALIDALQNGQIAGAGLDVFDPEPLSPDSPLLTLENVVLTPHTASYADETFRIMFRRVGEEAARTLRGRMPNTPVNPQIEPNLTWLRQ
ncbi:MAG TPA: C-terminal binding protein [Thermomicrobiales bacterium]|nr:C-terminal binding protein [Thermomicrobiales bacterium]